MNININTKFNIDDIVYIVLRKWDSDNECYHYYSPTKPAQIKGIDIQTRSEYIMTNQMGEVTTIIEYHFKNFDKNFISSNSTYEKYLFSTWEDANDYANKLNRR